MLTSAENVDRLSPSHGDGVGPVADFGKLASHLPVGGEGEMRSGDLVSWCGSGVLNHWLFWTSPCAMFVPLSMFLDLQKHAGIECYICQIDCHSNYM